MPRPDSHTMHQQFTQFLNYLGCEDYFGLISNTGGGYTFYRDALMRRLTRWRYNNVPTDVGGRAWFIRDGDDVWSPAWMPMKSELDAFECRHGLGTTKIRGSRNGVSAEMLYLVPLGETAEVCRFTLTNEGDKAKALKVFVLAGQSNMEGHAQVSTFDYMARDPQTAPILREMLDADGAPQTGAASRDTLYLNDGSAHFRDAGEAAVEIDRAPATARDAAGAVEQGMRRADQDQVLVRPKIVEDVDDLHVEPFGLRASEDGESVALHTGLDLVDVDEPRARLRDGGAEERDAQNETQPG